MNAVSTLDFHCANTFSSCFIAVQCIEQGYVLANSVTWRTFLIYFPMEFTFNSLINFKVNSYTYLIFCHRKLEQTDSITIFDHTNNRLHC